jgi:hypothetical protein
MRDSVEASRRTYDMNVALPLLTVLTATSTPVSSCLPA